jgi:hypothetical protein
MRRTLRSRRSSGVDPPPAPRPHPAPPGLSLTADVPFGGLLVPLQPFTTTATLVGNPLLQTVTITGPAVGGLVPALLECAPQLHASAF